MLNLTNTACITLWAAHLPTTVIRIPAFNIINDEAVLRAEFKSLIALVQQKIQNPTAEVATEIVTLFQSYGQNINANIDIYNQGVSVYNTAIATFRAGIQTTANAQLLVDSLKRIKKEI